MSIEDRNKAYEALLALPEDSPTRQVADKVVERLARQLGLVEPATHEEEGE